MAQTLQSAGIPCLEWPERVARAIGHAVRYAATRSSIAPPVRVELSESLGLADGPVPPAKAADILARYGIRTVESILCESAEESLAAAARLAGPVVMKTAVPSVAHRAEVQGVRMDLVTSDEVAEAYRHLSRLGQEVLVQRRLHGVEMVVGALRDPAFGPVVMAGLGGTAVELMEDVVFALAPISRDEAAGLLERLRGFPLLTGYRGRPAIDLESLCQVMVDAGRLISRHLELSEIDLNPLIATESGIVAVDWKMYVSNRPGSSPPVSLSSKDAESRVGE